MKNIKRCIFYFTKIVNIRWKVYFVGSFSFNKQILHGLRKRFGGHVSSNPPLLETLARVDSQGLFFFFLFGQHYSFDKSDYSTHITQVGKWLIKWRNFTLEEYFCFVLSMNTFTFTIWLLMFHYNESSNNMSSNFVHFLVS